MMNVLYIHTHDSGRAVEPYGYNVLSENYDDFFKNNIMFQNAFSVSPTCSPSRAALLTGTYPHQNGMLGLAQRGFVIDKDKHLANFLNKNGFKTVLCGVQHEFAYYTDHELAYKVLGYDEDISSNHKCYDEADLVFWDIKNSQNAVNWIKNYDSKQPFFMSIGLHATHRKYPKKILENIDVDSSIPPYYVKNNAVSREDFARYKTSLKIADDILGDVINTLKDKDIYENTIVILTTDHGLAYPFSKATLSDRGIGVLLGLHIPNISHKVFDQMISHIDIFPTLCDLLNLEKPSYLEGKSFIGLLKSEEYTENEFIYSEMNFHTSYEPARAIRSSRYKYIKYFDEEYDKYNYSNIDNSSQKDFLIESGLLNKIKPKEYLFDLNFDPQESNNLANDQSYHEVIQLFRNKLKDFMIKTCDPLLDGPLKIKSNYKVNKKTCINPGSKNIDDYESVVIECEE